jgi:glycosyltransferase involved in cell wall biosynthesis
MSSQPLPISVYFVSGAEVHRLGAALESVQGWAAEIIVVLQHDVSDGTEELARSHGALVSREPWKGFVGQKASGLHKTTAEWTLNLDADEVVPPALKDEIARAIAAAGPETGAFSFPRCTWFLGRWIRHGDWYPDRVIRLVRRGRAHWGGDEPHAQLQVDGRIGRLRSDLLHYSNESIDRQVTKIGPYSTAFVQASRKSGRRATWVDLLFRPCWRFLRGYLFKGGFLDGLPGYYIAWANAFTVATRYTKLRAADEGLESVPDQAPRTPRQGPT